MCPSHPHFLNDAHVRLDDPNDELIQGTLQHVAHVAHVAPLRFWPNVVLQIHSEQIWHWLEPNVRLSDLVILLSTVSRKARPTGGFAINTICVSYYRLQEPVNVYHSSRTTLITFLS